MLKIMICVNPNKDKELANTKKLLDFIFKYDVKVLMSDTFKRPYFDNPALSDTTLAGYEIEYIGNEKYPQGLCGCPCFEGRQSHHQ